MSGDVKRDEGGERLGKAEGSDGERERQADRA